MPRKSRSTRRSRRSTRRSTVGGGFFDFLFGSSEEKRNESANVSMPMNTGVSANVQASVGGKRKSRKARKSRKTRARKASRKH
jgi:hypothetical protein